MGLLHAFQRALELRVQPRVLDRDAGLRRERAGDRQLVLGEGGGLARQRAEDAHQPVAGPHRHREVGPHAETVHALALRVAERAVRGQIHDRERLAGGGHATRGPIPHRDLRREQRIQPLAADLGAHEPALVHQMEGDRVRLQQSGVEVGDAPLHRRGRPQPGDALADLHEGFQPPLPPRQLAEEVAVGERHRGLGRQRRGQAAEGLGVGQGQALDGRRRDEGPAALALAVDQGEHTDDLPARGLHGQDQQRLGAVPGERIHLRVEAVRAVRGQRIGVGHVEDLAGERHVAGQAVLAQRERDRVELDRHAVVLGQLEAQPARAVARGLDQVDGARVTPGDAPGLGQDQIEQELGVALAGQPHADRVQLLELLRGLLRLAGDAGLLARRAQHAREGGGAHRERERDEAAGHRGCVRGLREHDHGHDRAPRRLEQGRVDVVDRTIEQQHAGFVGGEGDGLPGPEYSRLEILGQRRHQSPAGEVRGVPHDPTFRCRLATVAHGLRRQMSGLAAAAEQSAQQAQQSAEPASTAAAAACGADGAPDGAAEAGDAGTEAGDAGTEAG
ncbi:MAG: hypothetical protein WEG40_04715, partial [Candidatus Rokuibacteriota bacterium]